jgi:hypothetical protein
MNKTLLIAAICLSASCAAWGAEGTPKIQFDQTTFDFGKTSQVSTVTGVFKFKNAGDGVLKLEAPKPTCGCTLAAFKSDTLQPGESGELPFTLHLGNTRATMEKHIVVKSNDPKTPEVSLAIKADYTPLYEVTPMSLMANFPLGLTVTNLTTMITRSDGKPLNIARLSSSQPWLTAKIETNKADASTARVRLEARRDGPPRRFNEFVHIYETDQTNSPVSTVYLYGQVMGELSLTPEALYWSVTDPEKPPGERPEATVTRRLTIRAADGRTLQVKNVQSSIKGLQLELLPKDSGRAYELVAKLDKVPASTISGNVTFETSVASQARVEVPVIVNVFKQ